MDIKKYIDNSLLKPNASEREVCEFMERSAEIGFKAVCLSPYWIRKAKDIAGKGIVICSVIGFPHGNTFKEVKVHEALRSCEEGAEEIDMVINISALKSGYYKYVEEEIKAVKRSTGVPLKVIVETCYLTEEEKKRMVDICINSGADFIKTSTGFGKAGADIRDVTLFKRLAGDRLKIKASGGIRTKEDVLKFIEAGAERIGTSRGFEIVEEG